MTLNPYSERAHGACSLLEPEPKFGPATRIDAPENFGLFSIKSSGASIQVAGPNFGSGSSREHAPWSLLDFGFKCIIAPSFADIFYNNCFKNGILPIRLTQDKVDILMEQANNKKMLTVDLEKQKIISEDDSSVDFDIDEFRKKCLIEGLDDIGLTLQKKEKITQYEATLKSSHPWII
jgi:3-isopropylmalate/(R)-2-methylmalate dehydratase small subunit